jgi:hypothetical protein
VAMQNNTQGNTISQIQMENFCGQIGDEPTSELCWNCPNDLTKCDEELSNKIKQCSDTGETMHKFLSAVTAACEAAFKVSRPGKCATKEQSALRRRYQRMRNGQNLRQERRLLYQEGNRLYQAKL